MDLLCAVFVVLLLSSFVVSTTLKLERAFPVETNISELIRRDQARHQRIISFDLRGSSHIDYFGVYFTKVWIGSPPKEFNLMVDTGSDQTWVSCKSCDGCPTFNRLGIELQRYDPYNSKTSSLISCSDQRCYIKSKCPKYPSPCTYEIDYLDRSQTKGFLVEDVFHFGTVMGGSATANTSKSLTFGCGNYSSGRLATSDTLVDGIMGLMDDDLSILSQFSSSGVVPQVFSHCLRGDNGGGLLVLGEILEPRVVYTPLVPSP